MTAETQISVNGKRRLIKSSGDDEAFISLMQRSFVSLQVFSSSSRTEPFSGEKKTIHFSCLHLAAGSYSAFCVSLGSKLSGYYWFPNAEIDTWKGCSHLLESIAHPFLKTELRYPCPLTYLAFSFLGSKSPSPVVYELP